jgi:hypothetical protein
MRHLLIIAMTVGTAYADPTPTFSATTTSTTTSSQLTLTPLSLFDTPQPIVPSLRLEAARVASERYQDTWRYPDQEAIIGMDGNGWFFGVGHYRPRTARSAALHAGSVGATLLGEILLSVDSPLAGLGALATGATLDAAGADADRDAEAAQPRKH